jgi:hypothetical protein
MKVGDAVTIIQSTSDKFVTPFVGEVGIIVSIQLGIHENQDKFMVQIRSRSLVLGINCLEKYNEVGDL